MQKNAIIIIPARLGSTRLPNKPLADICGLPMVIRVAQQALKAQICDVTIATGDDQIIKVAKSYNISATKTYQNHESGTDRIYEAICNILENEKYDYVINLQGDLPNIDPQHIKKCLDILINNKADISTLGSLIKDKSEINNPNVVKIVSTNCQQYNLNAKRALYFSRSTVPYGPGEFISHIGIYGYKREALKKFVTLKQSELEKRERLEQLRALENNMTIIYELVDHCPISIDTQEDLDKIRTILAQN